MRFYTEEECEQWLQDRKRVLPDALTEKYIERVPFPEKPYQLSFFAR